MKELVRRGPRLAADPSRVLARLFVPGQEGFDHEDSRVAVVLRRILALDEPAVQSAVDDVLARFDGRHRDLRATFAAHAAVVADRLDPGVCLSEARSLLVGATFTQEYALEGAALCNPSVVPDPDQGGVAPGDLRLVMSARAIGEGHRSSIELRSCTAHADGTVTIEPASPYVTAAVWAPASLDAVVLGAELRRLDHGTENADYVLAALGPRFTRGELESHLASLESHPTTRRNMHHTASLVRQIAERSYAVVFDEATALSERVLWPAMAAESHGMEDARFVCFADDDGTVRYLATYTAYDGGTIRQQLLETTDFRSFTSSPIIGRAAANKGLALFPRRIDGRYAALSRFDRESNSVAFAADPHRWHESVQVQVPARSWELLQLGNCGSPLETAAGWLVLTHGVGPMRTYGIGAMLLDLDDPTKVLATLPEPLLTAAPDERDGYVPNVVYSCGAAIHDGTLVLPYGISDAGIGIATVVVDDVLAALGAG